MSHEQPVDGLPVNPHLIKPIARTMENATIVCLSCGPSIKESVAAGDLERIAKVHRVVDVTRHHEPLTTTFVIAVSRAHELYPKADVLYNCDPWWWAKYHGVPSFHGAKLMMITPQNCETIRDKQFKAADVAEKWNVDMVECTGETGLETEPIGLRHGSNSGYQALGLAFLLGARRILMLGYDCMPGEDGSHHFWGPVNDNKEPPYDKWRRFYATIAQPLKDAGVEVINCSRQTALTMFPRAELREVL